MFPVIYMFYCQEDFIVIAFPETTKGVKKDIFTMARLFHVYKFYIKTQKQDHCAVKKKGKHIFHIIESMFKENSFIVIWHWIGMTLFNFTSSLLKNIVFFSHIKLNLLRYLFSLINSHFMLKIHRTTHTWYDRNYIRQEERLYIP